MAEIPKSERPNTPEQLQGCYCMVCLRIAPSWFHSDFLMAHDGFICIDCWRQSAKKQDT